VSAIVKQKPMRLVDAVKKVVEVYGMSSVSVGVDAMDENRMVSIHQNWWPDGMEVADFRLALGKWRGQNIGSAWRPADRAERVAAKAARLNSANSV